MPSAEETDQQIEIFKVKKLIKNLQAAKGNGTSMISLILPPGSQLSQVNKMLSDEYGTASNIKSRVNRLSVLGAITSTQQRLKLYNKCPKVILSMMFFFALHLYFIVTLTKLLLSNLFT